MKGLNSAETHFRVTVVSSEFEGLTSIKRHQLVYKVEHRVTGRTAEVILASGMHVLFDHTLRLQALASELAGPIHALTLKTKTPAEG